MSGWTDNLNWIIEEARTEDVSLADAVQSFIEEWLWQEEHPK